MTVRILRALKIMAHWVEEMLFISFIFAHWVNDDILFVSCHYKLSFEYSVQIHSLELFLRSTRCYLCKYFVCSKRLPNDKASMSDSDVLTPGVIPLNNISIDIRYDLSNITEQISQFDSGHVTWLLACTAVTWLMVNYVLPRYLN